MPLFPAYATKVAKETTDTDESQDRLWEVTDSREAQLLASDNEEDVQERAAPSPPVNRDFYLDKKLDRGNLRVSTLYYPGRPQYNRCGKTLTSSTGRVGAETVARRERQRYWARRAAAAADATDADEAAERAAAYRRLLLDRPADVHLWETFIDFQEICSGAEAALTAAEEAVERAPFSHRLRARLVRAARAALPREPLLRRLRELLASERSVQRRVELWTQLLEVTASAGASEVRSVALSAIFDTRAHPPAYPRLLHAYGVFLRMGGLWEELVLLVELLTAMTCAPTAFPPETIPVTPESDLLDREEEVLGSGLPLSTVWVRVERLRATAHWRPAANAADVARSADPQRAPPPDALSDLLRPVVGEPAAFLLCGTLLRLAKVPLMPGAGAVAHAWGTGAGSADCAEALLPLLRAARRLPPAHPARAPARVARRLLALLLEPPHYFTDESGYFTWVRSLWDACCGWVSGERRVALLCWRLRWLHAQMLLVDTGGQWGSEELRRFREEARLALKRYAGGSPLAFAQFARIQCTASSAADGAAAGGAVSGAASGARVALRALRAALHSADTPRVHALHIARITCEVTAADGCGARLSSIGAGALVAAVLGRDLPTAPPPPADLTADLAAALQICEERCAELERRFDEEADDGTEPTDETGSEAAGCCAALLPAEGEWAAARALLAPPARRAELLHTLLTRLQRCAPEPGAAGARYYEQSACALLAAGRRESRAAAARALAPLFPHNAYLALASAGAPLWVWQERSQEERLRALGGACAPMAALAAPLPALLRAVEADWTLQEAEACVRAVRRAERRAGAAGGALLGALRLETEGRAPRPQLPQALYAALDRTPAAKWLHVRGAAWCGAQAAALADLLLLRSLRTHALLEELATLVPARSPPRCDDDENT